MFEGLFQPTHLLLLLGLVMLALGPGKLPELGRSLGQGLRHFKREVAAVARPAAAD